MPADMGFLLILATVLIILVLAHFHVPISLSITAGSVFMLICFLPPASSLINEYISFQTLRILLLVYLAMLLVTQMRFSGLLDMMLASLKSMVGSSGRLSMVVPAFVGILPMPGGAMISAQMLKPVMASANSEALATVNLWFRHIWEYIWPLYSGVILAASIFSVSIRDFMWHMLFLPLSSIVVGYILVYRPMSGRLCDVGGENNTEILKNTPSFLLSIWPIILVMLITLAIGIDLLYSFIVGNLAVMLIYRKHLWKSLKAAFRTEVMGITLAALFFKAVVISSGAFLYTSMFFEGHNFPMILMLTIIPFLAGLMTGVTVGYVAISFPLFVGYGLDFSGIALAYAAGYAGHLLSPLHLCLTLSCEYLKVDTMKVIRNILLPVMAVLIIAIVNFSVSFI